MLDLYLLDETFTNGSNSVFLNFFSLASILSGIFVIISKNPVVSVLFLIALFLNIASYLMSLGINFIGLSYLLVYVGAVSILFIFILMLINVRISELSTDNSNSIPLAVMIGVFFNITLYKLLPSNLSTSLNLYTHSNVGHAGGMSYPSHYTPMSVSDIISLGPSNNDVSFVSSNV